MKWASRICIPAIAALVSSVAIAQVGAGLAHGKVVDRDGKPVQGATVLWENPGLHTMAETKTNKNGAYSLTGLYAGKYRATVLVGGAALMVQGEGTGNELQIVDNTDLLLNFNLKEVSGSDLVSLAASGGGKDKKPPVSKKAAEEMKAAFTAGTAALKASNYEEAARQFQTAAEKDPSQPATFVNLGLALSNLKKYDDAAAAYRQAISLKPGDSDTHGQLSLTLAHAGKIDDAMREVQEVGKLDKVLAGQSYYNIGAILVNGGKTKDAAEAFKKSVESDPKNAESYYQLGSAYFASPDTIPQAITAFEKYLELQPSGTYSAAAKQYISAGKNRVAAGK